MSGLLFNDYSQFIKYSDMQISLLTLWFNSCVEKAENKIREVKETLQFQLRQVNIEVREV